MNKQDARSKFRELRSGLSEAQVDGLSRKILTHLKELILEKEFIHIFLPIKKNQEINTWMIIDELKDTHTFIVSKTDFQLHSMRHFELDTNTTFAENQLGIPEPVNATPFDPQKIDTVLIPLLAYDIKGSRVGYGQGYYDQFLAMLKPDVTKIGLSFFQPLDHIETETHDIKLDLCVTPDGTVRFS